MKNVNAILLDSKNGKVKEIKFDGKYDSIHQLLGKNVEHIYWAELPTGDLIYYDFDQEENYTKKDKGFMFKSGYCRYGNGLIVGNQSENENSWEWYGTDVNVTKEMVEEEITFGVVKRVNVVC